MQKRRKRKSHARRSQHSGRNNVIVHANELCPCCGTLIHSVTAHEQLFGVATGKSYTKVSCETCDYSLTLPMNKSLVSVKGDLCWDNSLVIKRFYERQREHKDQTADAIKLARAQKSCPEGFEAFIGESGHVFYRMVKAE